MSRLPKLLREMVPAEKGGNRQLTRPSKEVVDKAFQMFWSAMAPLREAGKLGMLAFQFPPYFIPKPANFDYLASLSRTATGSLDRNRVPAPELGSQRTSTCRDHEISAIAWPVLHFDRRA
jgi:uncharacterized protein YecE (DUF72 family)